MHESEGELDLGDYLDILRRRWRWLAGSVLVVAGLVTFFTLTRDEVYESTAYVQILTENNQAVFNTRDELLFRRAISELQYMAGDRYQQTINELAGFDVEVTAAVSVVTDAEEIVDAGIIALTVEGPGPLRASAGAAAAADAYLADRLLFFVTSYERTRDNALEQRAELTETRAGYIEELEELNALVAEGEEGSLSRLALESDLAERTAELSPLIIDLSTAIGALDAQISRISDLLTVLEIPESTARISNPASIPGDPISPDVPRNLMIGLVLGIVVGLILAVLRDLLDPRARDGAELAHLVDIPVMATIGEIRSEQSAPGRVRRYRDLSAEESSGYQVLLNSLWLTNVDHPFQSIVLTSDRPGVGKTQTIVNLAQAEAARGTRVLIVDMDFANPSVAGRLEVPVGELGIADLLEGTASVESVVKATEVENLHIIDSHNASGAGELLRSDRLGDVLSDLYASYDLILIDSPPTLSTSDSRLVASQADAVIVVYDPSQSRREELQRTIEMLRGARANLVGLVANRSRVSHPVYVTQRYP